MEQTFCPRAATVGFWDGYARWYKLWMEHTRYHDKILDVLTTVAAPKWSVLDIGAGNGILSMPLCAIGCDVTAIEPSTGMRDLLFREAMMRGIDWLNVDERTWESVPVSAYRDADLIMACNSLHLTGPGLSRGLDRIFKFKPKRVFLASEVHPGLAIEPLCSDYKLVFSLYDQTDSSFAYHHVREAMDHWALKKGRKLTQGEVQEVSRMLTYRDEHYWIQDSAMIGIFWWERRDSDE